MSALPFNLANLLQMLDAHQVEHRGLVFACHCEALGCLAVAFDGDCEVHANIP
jgi:hypothetical protein